MTAREAAAIALGECRRKTPADKALRAVIENEALTQRDKRLATRIFNGVLQNMALCDYYIAFYSSTGLKNIEPRVLDIMRISAYQMVFLTKIPYSAAVNEGVALAKKYSNPRAAGFVNAVLRKIAVSAERGELPEIVGDDERRLSIKYSHPIWLVREFFSILGIEGAESLLKANNTEAPPVTAQVNTLLTDSDEALSILRGEGVAAEKHEWMEDCLELRGIGDIARLSAFKRGCIYIQDTAAKLVVVAAGPKPGDILIDGCAAPGGKSFAAAIAMENSGRIVAFDITAVKLHLIEDGARRLGVSIIEALERDASVMAQNTALHEAGSRHGIEENMADIVLADVPCSGFGVIRKKPDIRHKNEKKIEGLPEIQKRIIKGLSSFVKPGGVLMYSTCTILKRENEDVIEWFLQEDKSFVPEGFLLPGVGAVPEGKITLWPHIHGTDGFFICKLRRLSKEVKCET